MLRFEALALDQSIIFPGVRAVFDDPSRGQYFVAASGKQVVGCLMITHEWSDWRNGDIWWIQSVYVHADFRRKAIGRQLLESQAAWARQNGYEYLRFEVLNRHKPILHLAIVAGYDIVGTRWDSMRSEPRFVEILKRLGLQ